MFIIMNYQSTAPSLEEVNTPHISHNITQYLDAANVKQQKKWESGPKEVKSNAFLELSDALLGRVL